MKKKQKTGTRVSLLTSSANPATKRLQYSSVSTFEWVTQVNRTSSLDGGISHDTMFCLGIYCVNGLSRSAYVEVIEYLEFIALAIFLSCCCWLTVVVFFFSFKLHRCRQLLSFVLSMERLRNHLTPNILVKFTEWLMIPFWSNTRVLPRRLRRTSLNNYRVNGWCTNPENLKRIDEPSIDIMDTNYCMLQC